LKQDLTSPPRKPMLDEGSFQQLLSAAHVIQEHNDRILAKESKGDSAEILAEIVETQKQVMTGNLDLLGAAALIATRLQRITKSSGAAIGILQKDQLVYLAGVGSAASETGAQVLLNSSLSAACLQTGKILRCPNLATGPQRPSEPRRDNTARSLIVVPIHREGQIVGMVELRFAEAEAFDEDDVRACELMATLVTEALARADELDKREALAAERDAMLQILEKIKPQLERLVGEPMVDPGKTGLPSNVSAAAKKLARKVVTANAAPVAAAIPPNPPAITKTPSRPPTTEGRLCRGCGKEFLGDEAFCGKCGMTRSQPGGENGHLQSKWASLWYMQQAAGQAEVKRESDSRMNGNHAYEISPENKLPAARPQAPVSMKPVSPPPVSSRSASPKRDEVIPQAPVSRERVSREEKPAPRLPISLEEIVAQFGDETDLLPEPPPVADADPIVDADPVMASATEPAAHEVESDWNDLIVEIEPSEVVEAAPELEAEDPVYEEEAALVIRNPLGGDEVVAPASTALAKASPWTSAANARQWLDSMRGQSATRLWLGEQWRRHRANIYLGAAALLFVSVLISLFTQPALTTHTNPAEPQLTAFERLMVDLGLAEAPPTPVYLGNPDRQVWVDLHTALYYCPGSDLYGKTAGGRYETQRSAQLDQFEPASRRACD
jgi:GAF domain-containing protein